MGEQKDLQSRKWLLTINNPEQNGFSHDRIIHELENMRSLTYYCMCDEIGENGTYHTHLFICTNNPKKFSSLKNSFPPAHMDIARGTCSQNRDYVSKEGKWLSSKKKETNLPETFFEFGSMPIERQGQRNDLHDLYDKFQKEKNENHS